MAKNSAAKIAANNRYTAAHYDRLNICIPAGQKATLQAAAQAAGQSVNEYVSRALLARLGLDHWPELPKETALRLESEEM